MLQNLSLRSITLWLSHLIVLKKLLLCHVHAHWRGQAARIGLGPHFLSPSQSFHLEPLLVDQLTAVKRYLQEKPDGTAQEVSSQEG